MKSLKCAFLIWASIVSMTTFTANNPPTTISLDFQEIETRKALHILAKFIGLNLIIEDTVQGKISLNLSEVTAEEAIQAILHLQGLVQQRIGKTWVIRPQPKSPYDSPETKFLLETKRITLQHRAAKEIAAIFLGNNMNPPKTQGSKLSIDSHSNSLWIQDTPERIQFLEALVKDFDQVIQQILIEARIVSVDRNFEQTLGSRLGLKPSHATPVETTTNTVPNEEPNSSQANSFFIPEFNIDLPTSGGPAITLGLPLLWVGINKLLDLELHAMENEGNGRVISSPHLITTDRTPAVIEAGSEIPYQEKGRYGTTSLSFKKAVLSLKVTPQITPSGLILIKLHLNHDKPSSLYIQDTPTIDTQELKTQVLVKPGETVALGGIHENIRQYSVRQVPFLGKIPLLSVLFSYRTKTNKTRELLIFVTPHIISDSSFTKSNQRLKTT